MAIEMGLHRRESLEQNLPDLTTQKQAMKVFWCIYVLDRRWSFGTGMPFVLQDSDIDPSLPSVSVPSNAPRRIHVWISLNVKKII